MEPHWPPLIRALTDPAVYPHPVDTVEVVETHISYVLLTGDYAYKIKKALDLGFLDFSTLEKRRHACDEELRINRRTAPDLYLAVLPVTGTPEAPVLDGEGEPFEYMVRMAQFDPALRADRCLERGELTAAHLAGLGERVAELHGAAAQPAEDQEYGTLTAVAATQRENLEQLAAEREALGVGSERFRALVDWVEGVLAGAADTFRQRRAQGRVRECHGDLHLANMVRRDGELLPFDAIEFDPGLRFTDVMADVAFTWMDLLMRGRRDLGVHFLDRYLAGTGDYAGVRLLPFYTVYRALVRAKVAGLQAGEMDDAQAAADLRAQGARYFALAEEVAGQAEPMLVIARGVTGVGKSLASLPLLERFGGVRIRSDVERKRLAGLAPGAESGSEVGGGIYTPELSERTYARLQELARPVLAAGLPVFLDATYLSAERRQEVRGLAAELGVPFAILALEAPEAKIRQWLRERAEEGDPVSEGDQAVLEKQLRSQEPLGPAEQAFALTVDTSEPLDFDALAEELRATARAPD